MTKRRIFIALTIVVAGFIVIVVGGYLFLSDSEPFKIARKFVYENPQVKDQIGPIRDLKLSPFGFSFDYSGIDGSAKFKINAVGDKDKGVVFFELEEDLGEWKVKSAKLKPEKGEFITLR